MTPERNNEEPVFSFKPAGYTSVSPYLLVKDANTVLKFLVSVLDATPLRRYESEDGAVLHAELRIDDTVIMLGETSAEWPALPCHLHVYVPDVDKTFRRALETGAEKVQDPVKKEGDPDKRGGVLDPSGNTWWFSTQQE